MQDLTRLRSHAEWMSQLWERSALELATAVATGEASSEEVVTAHIARIERVNGALGAVVVRRYDLALSEARLADERRAQGVPVGPLHGVPVTIKDSQDVAGLPSTFGLPSRANDVAPHDDPYVAALRDAGAIVLGKTNVPQLLIYIESDNPLYGRTNNPWNLERTCGGSSGGEAAIIAAGGSPLGLGTDIGGSLRAPAAFCGIMSLKPTTGRLDDPTRLAIYRGQRAIVSQAGPLARTVADLALALGLVNARGGSALSPARALGDHRTVDVRALRIGYYEHAGALRASPALARATREAADAFAAMGAQVVAFEPPRVDEAMDIFFGILAADGARGAGEALGDDPIDRRVAELLAIASKPRRYIAAIEVLLGITGQRGLTKVVRNYGRTDTHHYWKLVEAQAAYRTIFSNALDGADGGPLDLLIGPPIGLPALPHGLSSEVLTAGAYAPLYNVLGFPAGTLPWSRVGAHEQNGRTKSRDRVERGAHDADRGSAGLPAGVQFIGRPWREDIVLAAMAALEPVARARDDFPRTPV